MTTPARSTLLAAAATGMAVLTLGGLFTGGGWLWPVLGAVAVVAVVGWVGRALRVPGEWLPLAQLTVLAGWLTAGYAGGTTVLGVLPGPGALRQVSDLVAQGRWDIAQNAAPVSPTPGITLLAAAGVGAVAVLVDLLVVTWRWPALAGLPLLAVYVVPTVVVGRGVGWGTFVLAAAGWLTLLLAESRDRLARWGRLVRPGPLPPQRRDATPPDRASPAPAASGFGVSGLGVTGRRIGASVLGLAVVLPLLAPNLSGLLPATRSGWGLGRGGTITVLNPMVSMRRDLNQPTNREVFRYTTNDPTPDYLRLTVLDTFDGTSWLPAQLRLPRDARVGGPLPPPPGLTADVPRRTVTTRITVRDQNDQWLPLPYPTVRIGVGGDWRMDRETRVVFGPTATIRRLSYDVTSLELSPTPQQLDAAPPAPADIVERYTRLPADLPPEVRQTALRVTAGATTTYQKALRLQEWLRSPEFTYDTSVASGDGTDALLAFLQDKRGYCQQFAGAMAVMARLLGMPTRVAVGFTQGSRLADGSWSVGITDAHAWPEVYLSGIGWVRFEPTPRPDGSTSDPAWAAASTGSPATPSSPSSPLPTPDATAGTDGARPTAGPQDRTPTDPGAGGTSSGTGGRRLPVVPLLAALAVLALLAVPRLLLAGVRALRWRRARDPATAAEAAWADLREDCADLGYRWPVAATPRQVAAALCRRAPLAGAEAAALQRLTLAVERARYAHHPGAPAAGLRTDAATVRRALRHGTGRRRRLLALLHPASTGRLLRAGGARVGDLLDGLDRLGDRIRAWTLQPRPGR